MALIIQKTQASLIGGGSLPQARATGAVPDFSGLRRLGQQLMTQGNEEENRKKAQDDYIKGLEAGAEFVGIGEDGKFQPITLPDGSVEFRNGWFEAVNANRDARFERDLADHFNTIQSDPDATFEQKQARLRAAAEGAIQNAPPDRKARYAEWANGQLTQRLTVLGNQELARSEQLQVEGITATIRSDVDKATSAAAAGLPQDDLIARIDASYDRLVKLRRMAPEAAAAAKAGARQVIVGQGLVNRLVTGMAKGEVSFDDIDRFGTAIGSNDATAEAVLTKTYRVGPGAQSTVAQGYKAKDVFGKITDEDIRKDMSLKLRQAATDFKSRAAAHAKDLDLIGQLRFQASPQGQNMVLPSSMRDDLDAAVSTMMMKQDPFASPEGEAALMDTVAAARYMPKPVISTLEMMANSGNPETVEKAVILWRKLTTLRSQSGSNVGQVIRSDVPEQTRNMLDSIADAYELGYSAADIQENIKTAQGSRNFALDQLILDYNRTVAEKDGGFEKDFLARWASDYKGAVPDPAAADSFARAYRQSMIILRDPVKAFDDAYARMKEIHKQSDIFVSGIAKGRGDLTNPYGYEVSRTDLFGNPGKGTEYEWLENHISQAVALAAGRGQIALPPGMTPEQLTELMDPVVSTFDAPHTPDFLGRTMKLQPVDGPNPDAPDYMIRMFDPAGNDLGYLRRPDGTAFTINPHLQKAHEASVAIYNEKRVSLETAAKKSMDKLLLDTIEKSGIDLEADPRAYEKMPIEDYLGGISPELEKEYRLDKMEIEEGLKRSLQQLEQEQGQSVPPSRVGPQTLMQPKAAGFDVAAAAAASIDSVLPDGTGGTFLLRVAAQESAFGTATGTYRMIGDKGIMQTNTRSAVAEVKRLIATGKGRVFQANEKLKAAFGLDLAAVTDEDLDKPLVSMAMARAYVEAVGTPVPPDIDGQAAWWKTHYNTRLGKGTVEQFVRSAGKVPDDWAQMVTGGPQTPAGAKVALTYTNQGAKRSLPVTPSLEAKLQTAVASVFGEGYGVEVFSGGQGRGSRGRTGTRRHNDGAAADVYITDPKGNRVTDPARLLQLRRFWLAQGYGSVGHFMKGRGMHFDEITKDKLRPGEALSWRY